MSEKEKKAIEDKEEKTAPEETVTEPAGENVRENPSEEDGKRAKKKKNDSETEHLKKELEDKEKELRDLNDKYMRMIAEYDNFRRRTSKEKEGIYTDAYEDVLKAVFPILDNIERASQYKDTESVQKGVEMTLKSFCDTLDKLGVKEIECFRDGKGLTFDPNQHNAVMHIEDEAYGEGEIVEVFQKGYKKGDKVLRYAMVKVAN